MNEGAALGLVLDQVSKDKNIDRACWSRRSSRPS